jgi:hypothetical protein
MKGELVTAPPAAKPPSVGLGFADPPAAHGAARVRAHRRGRGRAMRKRPAPFGTGLRPRYATRGIRVSD